MEKLQIVSDLQSFAERVESETGHTDFEAQGVKGFCLPEEVSVEECRARALKADKALTAFYQASVKLKHRQRELDQRQEEILLRREKLLKSGLSQKTTARRRKRSS